MLSELPQCLLQAQLDPGGHVIDQEPGHSLPTSDPILFVSTLLISNFSQVVANLVTKPSPRLMCCAK